MAYKVVTVDLTNAISGTGKQRIVSEGKPVRAISISKIPSGATFRLHLGQQDGIYIDDAVSVVGITDDEDSRRGIYYSNDVAQPGVTVELVVSFAGP
jgi:hypothetical protein